MNDLKQRVLELCEPVNKAKDGWMPCGSDSGGLALELIADSRSPYYQIGSPNHVVCLKFNEETHSESIVWELAAKILEVSNG